MFIELSADSLCFLSWWQLRKRPGQCAHFTDEETGIENCPQGAHILHLRFPWTIPNFKVHVLNYTLINNENCFAFSFVVLPFKQASLKHCCLILSDLEMDLFHCIYSLIYYRNIFLPTLFPTYSHILCSYSYSFFFLYSIVWIHYNLFHSR